MKKKEVYKKSLELLDQFIAETPKEELDNLVKKYESLNIQGPTFDQYLNHLQNQLQAGNWHEECIIESEFPESIGWVCISGDPALYTQPPPVKKNFFTRKKTPITSGSFFLINIVAYDRRKKRIFSFCKVQNPKL